AEALGLGREDGWAPGEAGAVPFVVARDALPLDTGDELGEEELVRLFRARGEERQRVFAAADRLRREVCGDEVSYVVTRNIQYTNVCYFRCGFCAFSKGKLAENLRGPAYLVPLDEIVRRSAEAWLEVHAAAHAAGLRSNVTMMFGHVERPLNWARHLLRAREQQRESGGFTEFVPLPFVHMEAPIYLKGAARPGPTFGETLLVH